MAELDMTTATLFDLIADSPFYDRVAEAARITKNEIESGFCIYGDLVSHAITFPIDGETWCFRSGTSRQGVNYDKKGYGHWKPRNKSIILDLHFHPPLSIAIPSGQDLLSHDGELLDNYLRPHQATLGNYALGTEGKAYFFNPVSVVGHSRNGQIRLFVGQYAIDGAITDRPDEIAEFLENRYRWKIGKEGRLDYADPRLVKKVADILNETRLYRACSLRFRNRAQFAREAAKLAVFKLVSPYKELV